jgi:hypothetical protein
MSVERGWWEKPVRIEQDRYGRGLNVSNTAQAERILYDEWPVDPGPKHLEARKAVYAARQKALDATRQAKAREAFLAAAKEAGIAFDDQ